MRVYLAQLATQSGDGCTRERALVIAQIAQVGEDAVRQGPSCLRFSLQ
jgi:hypothetical protein